MHSDILVIGGGIAGLSAAAALAQDHRVTVLEGEDALGRHSSGRSVSFSHYGIGNAVIRGLTAASRGFFENQPAGFADRSVARPYSSLYFADADHLDRLDQLERLMAPFATPERLDTAAIRQHVPILTRAESALLDRSGLKLDADALLHGFARRLRAASGTLVTGAKIAGLDRTGSTWRARTETGETFEAPVVVNAAGAWADHIGTMAGVRPLGLSPRRRTIIVVDPPEGMDIAAWPFTHSAAGDFYMLAEAGQLLVSPVDATPTDPCDAQPDEYDIAYAADRLEHYTGMKARRIVHRWAGLRSFVHDGTLVAGFAQDTPGFFWLAGQGGYGLQTAPAMARAVHALVTGAEWPQDLSEWAVTQAALDPARLFAA